MPQTYRFFLSSPGDLSNERQIVRRVVDRINADAPETRVLELFRWEEHFYTADETFQGQMVSPSECDIVVVLFWKRLGTDLPPKYKRSDGSVPTGTEYEFEQALKHAIDTNPKTPDVLVYRKTASVTFSEENLEYEKAQRDRFLSFWNKWFHSEKGHFVAAFQTFETESEFEQQLEQHLRDWLEKKLPATAWSGGSPFRGLQSYEIGQADIFFGRSRETDRARARLLANAAAGNPVLFVCGASGSGKSSLIRAGLLSAMLRPGTIPSFADGARAVVETPSTLAAEGDWAEGLARALFKVDDLGPALASGDFDRPEALAGLLRAGNGTAAPVLEKALKRVGFGSGVQTRVALVIAIDQLEEIFSYPENEIEVFAESFANLVETVSSSTPIALVFGMRSDHRHHLAKSNALSRLAGFAELRDPEGADRMLDVSPPGDADLREIILGPAALAGLSYETDPKTGENLAEMIEAEAGQDALPALQLLLSELYEHRLGSEMTIAAYKAAGGVKGVMAKLGNETLAQLPKDVQETFPRLLQTLATRKSNEGILARRMDADTFKPDQPEAQLVAAFLNARLLVSDGRTLRVAHESLLRDWPRAATYLEDYRRFFSIRERLGEKAREYATEKKTIARRMLLRDLELSDGKDLIDRWGAETVAHVEPHLPGFISDSQRAANRRLLTILTISSTLAAAVVFIGFKAWMYETEAAATAHRAKVNFQIAKAGAALRSGDNIAAVRAAQEAADLENNSEVNSVLATTLSELSPRFKVAIAPVAEAIAWNHPDSLSFADVGGTGSYDTAKQTLARGRNHESSQRTIVAVASLPDGGWITVNDEGAIKFRSEDDLPLDGLQLGLKRVAQADISVGTDVLTALADEYEGAWIRSCSSTKPLSCRDLQVLEGEATAIALSGDGRRLAVAFMRKNDKIPMAALYDITPFRNGDVTVNFLGNVAAGKLGDIWRSVSWSHDDTELVLGAASGLVVRSPTEVNRQTLPINETHDPVIAVKWSPRGDLIAATCNRNTVCLFNTANNTRVGRLIGHRRPITGLVFSPDGAQLATQADDEPTRIWTVQQDRRAVSEIDGSDGASFEALDAANGVVVAGNSKGSVHIWQDIDTPPRRLASPMNGRVNDLALSETGRLAVTFNGGDTAIWYSPENGTPPDRVVEALDAKKIAWSPGGTLGFVTRSGKTGVLSGEAPPVMVALKGGGRPDSVASLGKNRFVTSHTGGAISIWSPNGPLNTIPAEEVGDNLSAFSLSATPDGSWVIATRGDDILRLYSDNESKAPVDLRLLRRNTKVVAFSPSGTRIAALDAEGTLYVWHFEPGAGKATPLFTAPAVPRLYQGSESGVRAAVDMDWLNNYQISIATNNGKVILFDVRRKQHRMRAKIVTEVK